MFSNFADVLSLSILKKRQLSSGFEVEVDNFAVNYLPRMLINKDSISCFSLLLAIQRQLLLIYIFFVNWEMLG